MYSDLLFRGSGGRERESKRVSLKGPPCGLPPFITRLPEEAAERVKAIWKDYKEGDDCLQRQKLTRCTRGILLVFNHKFLKMLKAWNSIFFPLNIEGFLLKRPKIWKKLFFFGVPLNLFSSSIFSLQNRYTFAARGRAREGVCWSVRADLSPRSFTHSSARVQTCLVRPQDVTWIQGARVEEARILASLRRGCEFD